MNEIESARTALQEAVAIAIVLVAEALERLDKVRAPADIGAHLDLALHRMRATQVILPPSDPAAMGLKEDAISIAIGRKALP